MFLLLALVLVCREPIIIPLSRQSHSSRSLGRSLSLSTSLYRLFLYRFDFLTAKQQSSLFPSASMAFTTSSFLYKGANVFPANPNHRPKSDHLLGSPPDPYLSFHFRVCRALQPGSAFSPVAGRLEAPITTAGTRQTGKSPTAAKDSQRTRER